MKPLWLTIYLDNNRISLDPHVVIIAKKPKGISFYDPHINVPKCQ